MALEIRKLNPTIGAELSGVDLAEDITDPDAKAIHQALLDHKVIFFRDQDLSPERQLKLASIFGELEDPHPIFPGVEGAEQVTVIEHDANHPPQENVYHTDVTWREYPALGSVLHAIKVPENGGDTIWVNLEAAYAHLSEPMQAMLTELSAWHSIEVFSNSVNYEKGSDPTQFAEILKMFPPQLHPVVRTHPETGNQGLFVNKTFTTKVEGMRLLESQHLLNMLYDIAELPEFQVRFQWTKGSIAIWDNRCTHHYAVGDYMPNYRKMHRVTIKGDRPFYSKEKDRAQAAE